VYVDSEIEGTYKNALINLTAGTITSTTFTNTPILSNEGNGWYRFSVNVTTPSIVSPSVPIRVFLYNGVSINYAGNGTSGAYVWGFQFSKTSEVKPYRKTTATAGGSGFVSIWYDQSGNGNDLSQVTVANQPRIVNNGDLETKGNKVSIYSVSSDLLTRASLAFGNYPFNLSVFSVSYNEVALANASVFSTNTPLAGAGIQHFCDRRTQKRNTILYGATVVNTYDLSVQRDDSNQRLLSLFMNASTNATSAFDNGNAGTAGTVTGGIHTETAFNVLGTSSSGIQELIIYKADNSANRTGIESNINSYYSIY